ncbi:class II aldolase/adducin family protein [Gluconacetobacter sp. Hr-1-5]|uniref:class II aldolase/adducin family protein n=1 Tax=Gluconacetobacter sp. Hr-1-5 TaxID=3395370 RepID=UPI003B515E43
MTGQDKTYYGNSDRIWHSLAQRGQQAAGNPAAEGSALLDPPVFTSAEAQRQDSLRRLAASFRVFAKLGYEEGVMGHISFRDPEFPDRFWMNPFGLSFALVRVRDLMCITLDGQVVHGGGFPHIGGVPQHSAVYRANPDIQSVAHTHSAAGKAWSVFGRPLRPISTEAAVFHGRHVVYDTHLHGERESLGAAAAGNRAVIMQNHGILTTGSTVDETVYLFLSLEKVCAEQLIAEQIGGALTIPEEAVERISAHFDAYRGWLNFQPTYQAIVREQPDLLQ